MLLLFQIFGCFFSFNFTRIKNYIFFRDFFLFLHKKNINNTEFNISNDTEAYETRISMKWKKYLAFVCCMDFLLSCVCNVKIWGCLENQWIFQFYGVAYWVFDELLSKWHDSMKTWWLCKKKSKSISIACLLNFKFNKPMKIFPNKQIAPIIPQSTPVNNQTQWEEENCIHQHKKTKHKNAELFWSVL